MIFIYSQYRPGQNIKDNVYLLYERNNMKKIISKVKYCIKNNKSLVIALLK